MNVYHLIDQSINNNNNNNYYYYYNIYVCILFDLIEFYIIIHIFVYFEFG